MNADTDPPRDASLRLIVQDAEDLTVLSMLFQDALVRHGDMTFDARAKRFVLVASRFRWEAGQDAERVRTGLHFNHVLKVQHQGLDLRKPDTVAELLSLRGEEADGDATIQFDFAGGGSIRLEADCIDAEARDLGESWGTRRTPDHSGA